MFVIGELKDAKMIAQMVEELRAMGIEAQDHFDEKLQVHFLSVQNPDEVERALDYYRVKLGFKKVRELEPEWARIKSLPRGPITYALLVFCIVIYGMSFLEMGQNLYRLFFIGKPESGLLYEIGRGQIWRLITPIFLHLSFLHLLFNMLWFKDLGYLIEYKFGRNNLIALIAISGVISNLAQYFVAGPQFGGMSGVLYGMLGFIWITKNLEKDFEYALPKRDVAIMIGWLLACLTGFLGPIANTAHAGGLFVGMLFALAKTKTRWSFAHFKYFSWALAFLVFTIGVEGIKLNGRYFVLLWQ